MLAFLKWCLSASIYIALGFYLGFIFHERGSREIVGQFLSVFSGIEQFLLNLFTQGYNFIISFF